MKHGNAISYMGKMFWRGMLKHSARVAWNQLNSIPWSCPKTKKIVNIELLRSILSMQNQFHNGFPRIHICSPINFINNGGFQRSICGSYNSEPFPSNYPFDRSWYQQSPRRKPVMLWTIAKFAAQIFLKNQYLVGPSATSPQPKNFMKSARKAESNQFRTVGKIKIQTVMKTINSLIKIAATNPEHFWTGPIFSRKRRNSAYSTLWPVQKKSIKTVF